MGEAEVAEQCAAVGRQPDVAGFHVAMDDVPLVGVLERVGDVGADAQCLREGQPVVGGFAQPLLDIPPPPRSD